MGATSSCIRPGRRASSAALSAHPGRRKAAVSGRCPHGLHAEESDVLSEWCRGPPLRALGRGLSTSVAAERPRRGVLTAAWVLPAESASHRGGRGGGARRGGALPPAGVRPLTAALTSSAVGRACVVVRRQAEAEDGGDGPRRDSRRRALFPRSDRARPAKLGTPPRQPSPGAFSLGQTAHAPPSWGIPPRQPSPGAFP
jgi:hypothetical protein